MSIAIINSVENTPLFAQGVNTENSFYTDCPSITAAAGFVSMIADLDGLQFVKRGKIKSGIKINGFALFIHEYKRSDSKVAFNSGTSNYSSTEDKLINAPVPLEIFNAKMQFSIVIDYDGSIDQSSDELDDLLNYKTRRFNGGSIINNIMINCVDESQLIDYFKRHKANQVIDRSDLNITTFDELLEYIAFHENPETKRRDLKLHSGVFYAHQTGYQLLEDPKQREGALLNGDEQCDHAYCEPVINIAQLQHTSKIKQFSDLSLWQWQENAENKSIVLKNKAQ